MEVELNMAGLVQISNEVNEKIARPMAERIARQAGDGHEVRSTPRAGASGWARTRVFTTTPAAMRREVRTGNLSRALGG